MELRQLKYFVGVAYALNFSEAARKLFVTQGALSQQIKLLEDELGSPLFSRNSHSVALTEAGEELLPLAERTIKDAEDCKIVVGDLRKVLSGSLNIGLTYSFAPLFSSTVREFLKKYPGVNLKIHYKTASELHDMLAAGTIDFMLAFKSAQLQADLDSEPLFESDLCVIMRKDHPLASSECLTLKELERQGLALPGSGLQARKAFERFVNVNTSDLNVRVELNDPNIIMDLVENTNLLSVMSSLAIYYHPRLAAVPLQGMHRQMVGCVHWYKGRYRKQSAEAFVELLLDSAHIQRLTM